MKDRFARFMIGRYGVDDLSKFMLGVTVALMGINLFVRQEVLNTLVMVMLLLVYFRMFSRNIQGRYSENMKYLDLKNRFFGFFTTKKNHVEDRKVNHIYKCPECGQKIRIPRGKGKIMVTCPKCKHEFEKKS